MGWSSGGALLGDVVRSTQKAIPAKYRKEYYKLLIEHFEHYDCDVIDECLKIDKEFDKAFYELYPGEDE